MAQKNCHKNVAVFAVSLVSSFSISLFFSPCFSLFPVVSCYLGTPKQPTKWGYRQKYIGKWLKNRVPGTPSYVSPIFPINLCIFFCFFPISGRRLETYSVSSQWGLKRNTIKGRRKHINFSTCKPPPPGPKPPHVGPPESFMCLISRERTQKGTHVNFFRGIFWFRRGPKRAIFGHKQFSLLFFPCP